MNRREQLLDEVERRACRYFREQADPSTGLVRDRVRMAGPDPREVASIAATGFGLSALAIADRRGYLPAGEARRRAQRTLEYLAARAPQQRGFFYHFSDARTGERVWESEASSVDTAFLLCGALHAREHFGGAEIRRAAADLLDRMDWCWMLDGGATLRHGWTPEGGFLPYRWDCYAESMALYLLAVSTGATRLPAASWYAWQRPRRPCEHGGYIDAATPLFTHQYSHAWFDFRGRRDRYADYFENSRRATLAHRGECLALAPRFPWYGPHLWGVTAADSPAGYRPLGAAGYPPDGTLVPCAAGGSLAFLPEECGAVLETMLARYGARVWGRYGFIDSFHPAADWWAPDAIGINLGILLLMAENARSGAVWDAVMATEEARRAMAGVGLV